MGAGQAREKWNKEMMEQGIRREKDEKKGKIGEFLFGYTFSYIFNFVI
jgi:hypothetical protein